MENQAEEYLKCLRDSIMVGHYIKSSINSVVAAKQSKIEPGPEVIKVMSYSHRTTGCFDDRLLTMMTDMGFYVPWRVGYNFRLAKL